MTHLHLNELSLICDISPSILANKSGQPITNCNRKFLYGFITRNISSTTYQKSRTI